MYLFRFSFVSFSSLWFLRVERGMLHDKARKFPHQCVSFEFPAHEVKPSWSHAGWPGDQQEEQNKGGSLQEHGKTANRMRAAPTIQTSSFTACSNVIGVGSKMFIMLLSCCWCYKIRKFLVSVKREVRFV